MLGPTPHRPADPPIWIGRHGAPSLERVGRSMTAGSPMRPTPANGADQWAQIHQIARVAGAGPGGPDRRRLPDPDDRRPTAARGEERMMLHGELLRPSRRRDAGAAGDLLPEPAEGAAGLASRKLGRCRGQPPLLRFAGDHQQHLETGQPASGDKIGAS